MHSANFTALSRAVSFVFAPLLALPVLVVPVLEDALEPQPAVIRPTRPRATNGRSFPVMFAP
jgi:hypothetical protein